MYFERSFNAGRFTCTISVLAPGTCPALTVTLLVFAPATGQMNQAERTAYQTGKEETLRQAAAELGIAPLVIESTAPARSGATAYSRCGG